MSLGGIIGGVIGGVIGYFVPVIGWLYGASIGFSIGLALDPITPDVPSPGSPLPAGSEMMISTVGDPLPDLVGTAKIPGHLLCFGKERVEAIMTQVEGGKGGSSPDPYVSGYKYYMSWAVGIVTGPVDMIYAIYRNEDDVVWEGALELPASGGQETIVLEGMGSAIFYFGTDDQVANEDVGDILGDDTLNSPYRNFCWCFFDDCYIGEFNRCPTMKFVVRKSPVIAFSEDNVIQIYDYNPMHAMWYTLHDLAGLPETWLHSADFASAAATLANETRGICCLFNNQQAVLNYLESFNSHMDGIIRYGSDGKFHPKLLRNDYVIDDLPLIDGDKMVENPSFKRKSWIDTVNEVKVQYTELIHGLDCNIFTLFEFSFSNIFGVHFDGGGLTLVGTYVPPSTDLNGLILRNGNLVTMGDKDATAELRCIGTSAIDGNLPLLSSHPISNQYDVVDAGPNPLAYDLSNDRIFYGEQSLRLLQFNGLVRNARGFFNVVTTGTDGNLYVPQYCYADWSADARPITGEFWEGQWALIPDNVCDSPIIPWGSGTFYTCGASPPIAIVYYSGYIYIAIKDSPYSYLRKINPSSLEIEASITTTYGAALVAGFGRIFVLEELLSSTVRAYDPDTLAFLGEVNVSGYEGAIEIVGDHVVVITAPYSGGDSGIFKLNPASLVVADSLIFSSEMGALLYQTLAAINSNYVASGRNNGISVFSVTPLTRVADLAVDASYGYGSQTTVVKAL